MFYKIVDITDHDGNTKIDPVYQKRIGRIVSSINFVPITQPALFDGRMVVDWFNPVIVGIRAALTYAYDNQGNALDCIETLHGLEYVMEPEKGIFNEQEILKYAPNSISAAKIRIKNNIASMNDFYLVYSPLIWKIILYYLTLLILIVPIAILFNWSLLIFLVLFLIPIYKLKKIMQIKTDIQLNKVSSSNTKSFNEVSNLVQYEKKILELKEEFETKKMKAEELIEKRFAPPQLTYDKFMSTVENAERIFMSEIDSALDIVRYTTEYSPDIEEQIKEKIKTLKILIKQIDDLLKELVLTLSKDKSKDDEIKNIINEMDRLINSISQYD